MKATELKEKLEKLIAKHGDCEVLTMYDASSRGFGCLEKPDDANYYEEIEWNAYADDGYCARNVIVIE